jgi:hypothetical protein
MSGSAPTNSAAVDFEKQQAAEADAKEAARQGRLTQGQTLIDQIFNGQPVMGTKTSNFDWSTFNPNSPFVGAPPSGVPAGYTAVRTPSNAAAGGADPYAQTRAAAALNAKTNAVNNQVFPTAPASTGGVGASAWGLQDASGKIYKQGDPLSISSTYDTGQKTGGFDDAFYNNYKQKVLDYYQPDEQRQYDAAQRDLRYHLADAGMLQSSVAADKQGELAYNDALQKANIVSNANAQEGNLKSQIQANKQSLINQLYSTEDPTLTANLAQSSANATRLQDPTLTPAAALFTPALSTVGSAVGGMLYPGQSYGSTAFGGGVTSPTPAPASGTGSSKLIGV